MRFAREIREVPRPAAQVRLPEEVDFLLPGGQHFRVRGEIGVEGGRPSSSCPDNQERRVQDAVGAQPGVGHPRPALDLLDDDVGPWTTHARGGTTEAWLPRARPASREEGCVMVPRAKDERPIIVGPSIASTSRGGKPWGLRASLGLRDTPTGE